MGKKLGTFIAVLVLVLVTAVAATPPAGAQRGGTTPTATTNAAGRPLGAPQPAEASLPTPPTAPLVRDVLPGRTAGDAALAALSPAELALVAEQNGQSTTDLTDLLARDSTAFLDADGMLFFEDPPAAPETLAAEKPAPGPFPNGNTFLLHSRPGSARTLYLDFDGYALPAGTGWNGGAALNALPWDSDGNGANWSQSEIDTIQSIWQRVSEDYAPFDIDVTTQDPGYAAINRASTADNVYGTRVVITDTNNSIFCSCGGVAYVGTIDSVGATHDYYQPAWAFATGVGDGAHNLAEVASHEAGHNLGLSHDGTTTGQAYYAGHGMWAPIMGNGYGQPVTQWSRGEYTNADNTEDDYVVANANGVALIADEAGCAIAATDLLQPGVTKVIAQEGDCDAFRYNAPCSGVYTVTTDVAPVSPDLSVQMNLWNWNGSQISNSQVQPVRTSGDVASGMGESTAVAMTAGAAYTIAVFPLANLTPQTGFSNYGNRGQFSVRVSTPCGADAFASSSIGGPFDTRSANNAAYTTQTGEPNPTCGDTSTGSKNTAWWNWTAPGSGTVTIDTVGSNFDTVLAVYTGSSVASLSQVTCNDDGVGLQSRVSFAASAGTTYRVQVDGYGTATGNITLNTNGCVPATNNTFACASTLGTQAAGSNVGFTGEGGEPVPACGIIPTPNSAWWNWTSPGNGSFTIDTFGSTFDTVLGVYTGAAVNGLTPVTCNDDSGGLQSSVTLNATAGTVYRIQVNGYNGASGNIALHVTDNRPKLIPGAYGTLEGDSGAKIFNIPITLSAPSTQTITVNYGPNLYACEGCATEFVDYVPVTPGTLTFLPGETVKTVPVIVIGDTVKEPALYLGEWFFVRFQSPSLNAQLDLSFLGLGIGIIGDEATDH
jgi:hypothetical protein